MARKPLSPQSLANLKPQKKGEPSHSPNGRKGKDGLGGYSWKSEYKRWLKLNLERDPDYMLAPIFGLYRKACEGDVKALDRLREMNDEVINDVVKVEGLQLPPVIVTIVDPKAEDDK